MRSRSSKIELYARRRCEYFDQLADRGLKKGDVAAESGIFEPLNYAWNRLNREEKLIMCIKFGYDAKIHVDNIS